MVSLEKSSIWIIIPGCFEMDSQASCFNHVWGTAQWLDGDKQPGGEKLAPSGIAHPSCESTRIHQKHYPCSIHYPLVLQSNITIDNPT